MAMAQGERDWSSGFWSCCSPFGTCFLGCCCPCILYSKNKARKLNPAEKDPSGCNGDCAIYALLMPCTLERFLIFSSRGDTRAKYGIQGSSATDCLQSFCCGWCALMQEDKEIVAVQEKGMGGRNGEAGYAMQDGGMEYSMDMGNNVAIA